MTADDAQIPREQLPIPLFDGVALAARAAAIIDDHCYAPVVEQLGERLRKRV